jgi:cytochrome c peroxidase
MWRSRVLVWALVGGCAEPLVDDTFTPDQFAQLRADIQPGLLDTCHSPLTADPDPARCDDYARLGQELFFERAMSGPLTIADPSLGNVGDAGKVACITCHDPNGYYIDTRPGANVSLGAKRTKHNALTLVNLVVKESATGEARTPVFSWVGSATQNDPNSYAGDVFEKLALAKAMNGSAATAQLAAQKHLARYQPLFGDEASDPATALSNVEIALDFYMRRLVSIDSPFERFLAGDDGALSPSAKHGFELFAGPAICIECHHKATMSDLEFHANGIDQSAPNLPPIDNGRGDITGDPADQGLFLTPSLRNVAKTAPYMHGGQLATLDDVVAFYRRGGGDLPAKDHRIIPLDFLTDQDAADLVEFLRALTGTAPDAKYGIVDANGHVMW